MKNRKKKLKKTDQLHVLYKKCPAARCRSYNPLLPRIGAAFWVAIVTARQTPRLQQQQQQQRLAHDSVKEREVHISFGRYIHAQCGYMWVTRLTRSSFSLYTEIAIMRPGTAARVRWPCKIIEVAAYSSIGERGLLWELSRGLLFCKISTDSLYRNRCKHNSNAIVSIKWMIH